MKQTLLQKLNLLLAALTGLLTTKSTDEAAIADQQSTIADLRAQLVEAHTQQPGGLSAADEIELNNQLDQLVDLAGKANVPEAVTGDTVVTGDASASNAAASDSTAAGNQP